MKTFLILTALTVMSVLAVFTGVVVYQNMLDGRPHRPELAFCCEPNPELSPAGIPRPYDPLGNAQQFKDAESEIGCHNAGGSSVIDPKTELFVACIMPHEVIQGEAGVTGYP